jgi:hypothetical protein
MPARELHSLFVFYICPRPVVLVSVADGDLVNIFPMDLIGSVAPGYFSLALHGTSAPTPLMERSRRIALSSVPVEQAPIAYELGKNHKRTCIDWNQIPFTTRPSPRFLNSHSSFSAGRELQIEAVRTLGTPQAVPWLVRFRTSRGRTARSCFVHGFYQAWRRSRSIKPRGLPRAKRIDEAYRLTHCQSELAGAPSTHAVREGPLGAAAENGLQDAWRSSPAVAQGIGRATPRIRAAGRKPGAGCAAAQNTSNLRPRSCG